MQEFATYLTRCIQLCLVALAALGNPAQAKEENTDSVMEFFRGEPDTDYPAPAPLLVNARARDYQSLNGRWEIVIDESGMGWNVITQGNYFDNETIYPETGMRLLERSFDSRKQLQVPGDWNSQVPELDRYRSKILYHKALTIEPQQGKRYFLHFDGANYTTDLFVNNKLVGRHRGGYTAFNFDITNFIVPGKNIIIVRVDAFLDETTIPTMRTSDFWKYGGITRDVGLIAEPETYIAQYHVYLADLDNNEIRGWVQLGGGSAADRQVTVNIPGADLAASIKTGQDGRGEFTARAKNLALWSPQSPKLYDVALSLDDETIRDRIGFRTVSTRGDRILLNGEPMAIRGISMHEETIRHPGLSNSREDVQAQFDLVKELNANFVRLAHYPHNEYTVRLADEMGLMLWSEVPIVSLIDWENPQTLAIALSQVTDNVTRDMNRASIVTWSISNESFPQSQARLDFLARLAATVRDLDQSHRPVASALVGNPKEEFADLGKYLFTQLLKQPDLPPATRERLMQMAKGMAQSAAAGGATPAGEMNVVIDDPLGEVVDIVGYNEYFGWYYSAFFARALGVDEGLMRQAMLSIMPNIRFANAFRKPMIVSEFGAGAKAGYHSDQAIIWSEEYQAKVYRAQLAMLSQSPAIQGFTPWVLKDFRSHLRELNGIQETYNRKGLVSETGEKKLAFKVLADFYLQELQGEQAQSH